MSRDLCVIYDVTRNVKIFATNNTTQTELCNVIIGALYSTTNVASFTTECKNDHVIVPSCTKYRRWRAITGSGDN